MQFSLLFHGWQYVRVPPRMFRNLNETIIGTCCANGSLVDDWITKCCITGVKYWNQSCCFEKSGPSFLSQKIEFSTKGSTASSHLRHSTKWKALPGGRQLNDASELLGCSLPLSECFGFFSQWPSVQTCFLVLRFLCIVCLGAVAGTERFSSCVMARQRNA